ncbi:MAG TPA: ABC transporter permease [Planctomycetota bacterium]
MPIWTWIPGLGPWKLGQRKKGAFLLGLFLLLLGLALWRTPVVGATLAHSYRAFRGDPIPFTTRHVDFLVASLFLAALLAGLMVYAAFSYRRAIRRGPDVRGAAQSQSAIVWRQFRKNRLAVIGAVMILLLYLVAFLAPFLAPADPTEQGHLVLERLLEPSSEHPVGTDRFARDVFSRIIYGSRISLLVGFLAVAISTTIGTVYGSISGYYGGKIDALLMRFVDIMLSFPTLILIITIIGVWRNQSIWVIITIIGVTSWMGVARLVRGEFLVLKQLDFFQAARALGAGPVRLIFRHLLPNAMTPIIISSTLLVGGTILLEASLSFLGLGVQPPTASWGNIVYDTKGNIFTEWWMPLASGLAILVTVTAYNLLGDGLRDALDPRLRQ